VLVRFDEVGASGKDELSEHKLSDDKNGGENATDHEDGFGRGTHYGNLWD
jgi:hypothetical protein